MTFAINVDDLIHFIPHEWNKSFEWWIFDPRHVLPQNDALLYLCFDKLYIFLLKYIANTKEKHVK